MIISRLSNQEPTSDLSPTHGGTISKFIKTNAFYYTVRINGFSDALHKIFGNLWTNKKSDDVGQ